MTSERVSHGAFLGVAALLFAASASLTIAWCGSMATMRAMPMPGGTMAMAGMRMPESSWTGAASFLGMWVVMMVAMMLPALLPMLQRYRLELSGMGARRLGLLTAVAGGGYFFVWTAFGVVVLLAGALLAGIEKELPAVARAAPIAAGVVVTLAGALQFTAWKARQLRCCRETSPGGGSTTGAGTGWRRGLHLGLCCARCCAGLMAILLVVGVMDLRAMALVTAAISAERLAPAGERVARALGVAIVATGLVMIGRAARLV